MSFFHRRHRGFATSLAGEIWAMQPRALESFLAELSSAELSIDASTMRAQDGETEAGDVLYGIVDGVARIDVSGPIVSSVPWWASFLGMRIASAERIMRAVSHAAANQDASSILLAIDSPGGTVAGLQQLADAVFASRDSKPIAAHIENLGASAAYWLASQADTITANDAALVGSIGVFTTVLDASKAYEAAGFSVRIISSGPLKGSDEAVPMTGEQLAGEQRIVDGYAARFVAAIARGRGASVDEITKFATGAVWFAAEAQALGLIDAVSSIDGAHGDVTNIASAVAREEDVMSMKDTQAAEPRPADNGTASNENAALAAQLAASQAKVAKLEAENAAKEAALASARDGVKTQAIDDAATAGKVTPAMRASVEAYAKHASADELRAFLASLPVQTRAQAAGVTSSDDDAERVTKDEIKLHNILGMSAKEITAFASVCSMSADRKATLADGRIVSAKEVN